MSTNATGVPHEPSAWLRNRLNEIESTLRCVMGDQVEVVGQLPTYLVPLGPMGTVGSWEERTCDRCRTYVPVGQSFYPIALAPLPYLVVTGGLCPACADLERGPVR